MAKKQATNKKKLVEVLEKSPIVEFACKKVGISRATFYRWRKEDYDFASEVNRAINQGSDQINDLAEAKLIGKINEGHVTAIIFWLKYRHPEFKKVYLQKAGVKEGEPFQGFAEMVIEANKVLDEANLQSVLIDKTTGKIVDK